MNERIKEIRKKEGLSQQKFADKLGIARGNIAAYEVGKNAPSDAVISLICSKFNVNEVWLRTGNGEPTIKLTRNQEIAKFANDVMDLPDKNIKKRFIEALAKLNENDWETIAKIAEELTGGE